MCRETTWHGQAEPELVQQAERTLEKAGKSKNSQFADDSNQDPDLATVFPQLAFFCKFGHCDKTVVTAMCPSPSPTLFAASLGESAGATGGHAGRAAGVAGRCHCSCVGKAGHQGPFASLHKCGVT